MDIVAVAPLRATAFVFQPLEGRFALAVVQKLTFLLAPEECVLAPEQEEIREQELHFDDDPRRSLRAPSDVAPFKRRADVLLVGSAFAPGGRPVRTLTARIEVAGMEKAIEVHGPRLFAATGELRGGAAWAKMPLRYERAAGGPDTWNPAGVWLDGPRDPYGQRHLPNLQPEGVELLEPGQFVPPIGFGPIASAWPMRVERLHGRTDVVSPAGARRVALGDDFDPDYFQDAPIDQQVASLSPNEAIVLTHLHSERERFVTKLPGLRPRATMELPGEPPVEIPLSPDTLLIDTDRGLCTLTFRGNRAIAEASFEGRLRIALVDVDPVERSTEESLPVQTTEISAAGSARVPATPRISEVAREITAVESPSPAARPLPFLSPSPDSPPAMPPVAPPVTPPRAKTMPHGSLRGAPLQGRRMTEEVVIPPGALAGPAWLASHEKGAAVISPLPAPPPPPAPPNTAPPAFVPNTAPPGPSPNTPPPAPVPPPLVSLAASPAALPPTLGDLSTTALGAAGPALRTAPQAPEIVRLGEVDARALSAAASVGVLSASNAAAGPKREQARSPAVEAADPRAENKADPAGYIELLAFEKSIVPRLRAHKVFSAWMKPPPKAAPTQQGKPPPPPPTPEAIEKAERADIHHVLSKDPQAAHEAGKPEEDDDADPPLVLAAGTLVFPFDEIRTLEAAIACAKPLAATDKKVKEALDLAAELLRSEVPAPEAAEALTARIRDASSRAPRPAGAPGLDAKVEQRLLEERRYQRRGLLDGEWLRALLSLPSGELVVAYLPVKLEKRLPLFARFPVKILAEIYPQQDPSERSAVALKVVAIARVTGRPRLGK